MTECDYNLLDEEWIPVLLTDGGVEKVGILGAFERANDIEDLACELPTQKIAIQRVLLAICYRAVSLEDEEDWKNLWHAGLPTDQIREFCVTENASITGNFAHKKRSVCKQTK